MAKILIVDDSPTDVHVCGQLLQKHGYDTVTAGTAEQGIEKARSEKPDLILMDVIMPGMNGFQATRSLSDDEQTAHIPVIIVSTKTMQTDRVWGLRQGASEYLTKPINDGELLEKVSALLQT